MNDHTVTENIVQAGFKRSATISCSCGLLIEIADLRKTSLSVVRKRLKEMHENKQKPKTGRKIVLHKEKKYKKQKLAIDSDFNEYGDDNFATPSLDPDIQDEQKRRSRQ